MRESRGGRELYTRAKGVYDGRGEVDVIREQENEGSVATALV